MPPLNSQPKHRSSSTRTSLPSAPHIQPERHTRFSSCASLSPELAPGGKTRTAPAPSVYNARGSPERRANSTVVQSRQPQQEKTERKSQTRPAESQHRSHSPRTGLSDQKHPLPAMRTNDILKHPRLREVTGLLPRKLSHLRDVEIPPDELYRLRWAMNLPEPFPSKRPRGNF